MAKARARRQGLHRLQPERRAQDDGLRLLAARPRAPDGVDADHLGRGARLPRRAATRRTSSSTPRRSSRGSPSTATSSRPVASLVQEIPALGYPRYSRPWTSREPPALEGVEHRYVDVRGARMHVADTGGDGPPVVLLHGWPQHWWTWHGVIELLKDDFRVIAPDLRGFGWSEATPRGYRKEELADDVVGVLDALELDSVNLAGHDWGGIVGFIVCVEHPERVRRFVPMNTGHIWPRRDLVGVPEDAAGLRLPGPAREPRPRASRRRFAARAGRDLEGDLDALGRRHGRGRALLAALRRAARGRGRRSRSTARSCSHDYPSWVRGRFADERLTTPTLWLNGVEDPVFKRGAVESVAEARRRRALRGPARLRPFPAAGAPGPRRRAAARVLRRVVASAEQAGARAFDPRAQELRALDAAAG